MSPSSLIAPVILIVLGVLFLVNNLGFPIPVREILRNFWPFILIGVGIVQLIQFAAGGVRRNPGSLTSGIILLTIGSLFALDRLFDISFRYTWPVILIAVGVALILRLAGGPAMLGWNRRGIGR